ncbi:MAG: 2-phosphosulfolactate phosphatase, partial [Candidatus Rokuibacteriota bacterium]
MRVDVAPTAEALAGRSVEGIVVLVIDVLRASTTIVTALANGCAAVVPVADPDEARRRAGALPPGTVLTAGERRGEPIQGFDLGNSPIDCTAERVRGRVIVFTTSNGTRALLAARAAAAVGVAALVNASAAAAWALGGGRDVTLLCAGERGAVSLEDHVCAGLLAERLHRDAPSATLTPAAAEAVRAARGYGKAVARLAQDSAWARHLARTGRG